MSIRTWWRWNRKYVDAVNSYDNMKTIQFFDELIESVPNAFSSKLYLWNVLRGKSFYIYVSKYVTGCITACDLTKEEDKEKCSKRITTILEAVLASESNLSVKRSLIQNICKTYPLITAQTLPYIHPKAIRQYLQKDVTLYTDEYVQPFMDQITSLRSEVRDLKVLLDDLN